MSSPNDAYHELISELREIALLGSVGSVLHWDEQTQLPPKGYQHRANQLALLARLTHDRFTSPRIGQLLEKARELEPAPDSIEAANIHETRRSYDRAVKIPSAFVEKLTHAATIGQHVWADARKNSDFAAFRPHLATMLDLKKQEAEYVGYEKSPYDALLDEYEPGETSENLTRVFGELRQPLADLIRGITESGCAPEAAILERHYPEAEQEKLAREAAERIGFDFKAGRLDRSVHPFCSGIGPGDTRLTTRYDEHYFGDAFFGVLHETGHGLYDQGLDPEQFGAPTGEPVSLGIHESQSRLWENFVGRGRPFWEYFFPRVQETFPAALGCVSMDDWYFAVNAVTPSLIRTESDETTYNLHILLRFDLERGLITGEIGANDVPAAWNEGMRKYLGITPPNDAQGCLQDIHWSGGGFGYFPTYTLGNLYAAQFYDAAREAKPELEAGISVGDFGPLLQWLREHVHRHGKRFTPAELCRRATGKPLTARPLLDHLKRKARELYGVS